VSTRVQENLINTEYLEHPLTGHQVLCKYACPSCFDMLDAISWVLGPTKMFESYAVGVRH
jgi:hypothetical protein